MAVQKPIRYIRPTQSLTDWISSLVTRRETLWFFIWRDLKVQYEKPLFGLLWSVFQPLLYFAVILGVIRFSGRETDTSEMPFELYLISGLSVWNFCTSAILGSINSVQSNASLITKSFFPRFYLILAPVLKSSIDFFIMILITFVIALVLGQHISLQSIPFTIGMVILVWLSAVGLASIATSATILYRHVRHAIPVLLYVMIFMLPVFYSISEIENKWLHVVQNLNPIAGSMDCFRASFGGDAPNMMSSAIWIGCAALLAIIGIAVFRSVEKSLSDRI